MKTFEVVVYGDGKLFREYFHAITAFFGTNDFTCLFNISLMLATVTVCYSYITKRSLMVLLKWFGIFYVAVFMLFTPRATIVIVDRINGIMGEPLDNVPWGLAVLASYTSVLDDALTRSLESTFTMPDYMPYHKTGMIFASRLMSMANQFQINDSVFDSNLKEFIHQCVFYDILLSKYSIDDLMDSKNVWQFVSANASPARAFMYNGMVTTCKEGSHKLTSDWQAVLDHALNDYSQRIYPDMTQQKAKAQILIDLPESSRYLTDVAASAQEIMQQNMMANAIERGVVGMGAKLDASAALESYAFTRAEEQKRLANKTTGEMAAEWLAKMKIAVEAILYGSFIFVVLLAVFPFGGMVLRNYAMSLLWVHLWAPMYAIINLMVSYDAQSKCRAATHGISSLKAMPGLLQINSDIAGLAGCLSMAVPFIVSGIVFGMHKALSQGIQNDMGITQGAMGSSVNEAVTGNFSFGNTSLGTHQANNISTNHVDTSARLSSGMLTTQLAGGSLYSTTADGSHIMNMQGSLSNLGASINLMDGLRSSYAQQVERAESAALTDNTSIGQSLATAARASYDLSNYLGKSDSSSDGWSTSTNAAVANAINQNARLTEQYGSRHGLTAHEAANVLANACADAKISAGLGPHGNMGHFGASGSGGVSRQVNHNSGVDKSTAYSDAMDFIRDTNYAKNLDLVSRASHDHSLRFNNEEANRLANTISSSFDRAESARHDFQSHYQEAQNARENASRMEEHAATIQINGNQEYNKWLENRPGTNGHGKMGSRSIEAINKDPHLNQYYANQFIEQYKAKLESGWNHGMASSKPEIHRQYEMNNKMIPNQSMISSDYDASVREIKHKAHIKGLDDKNLIDTSIKQNTISQLSNVKHQINDQSQSIIQQGESHQHKIIQQEEKPRSGSLWHDFIHGVDTTDNVKG